ncbi:MAG TPA: hypothetical protein VK324_13640, partial [Tepidisphaeraceae bacterium]|nr:hypothetical protein [Tepidisphaeraceae bacterium]
MAWFGSSGGGVLSIDVGRFVVHVSRATAAAGGADGDPTYGAWTDEPRLVVHEVFYGSSVAGPSYAKLAAATGRPISAQVDVEDSPMLLMGDRVAIGIDEGSSVNWLFGGYLTGAQLGIDPNEESLVYRCTGPEWLWGAGAGTRGGAHRPVYGQWRRKASADDAWAADTSSVTPRAELLLCPDLPAVFNPGNRKNMTKADVVLSASGPAVNGRVWETPDRKLAGADQAEAWHKFAAFKTIVQLYNDPAATGISVSASDWSAVQATVGLTKVLRDVDVDTLPPWAALQRVLGAEYGFYVTPRPSGVTGNAFGGFRLKVFSRSQDIDGTQADLRLAVRGTGVADAPASVVRLAAFKDVAKTVTAVTVLGRGYRGVKLKYNGSSTPSLGADAKKVALQHGWSKAEGDLATFATSAAVTQAKIDEKPQATRDQWRDRHTVGGKEFARFAHVFRLFTWNEAGELGGQGPTYVTAGTVAAWYAPDLTGICDAQGLAGDPAAAAGSYVRRRRRPGDTQYYEAAIDGWRRVPPTLFIGAQPAAAATEPAAADYVRVPTSHYRVDPERCAVWIAHPDLAAWQPFVDRPLAAEPSTADDRTFATLLHNGKLRLVLECSVEADGGVVQAAKRVAEAGSPHVRHVVVRAGPGFVASAQHDDGQATPTGAVPAPLGQGPDALKLAEQMRTAGQDEQVHASALVEAVWPEQAIGKMVKSIAGRNVQLTATSGRGAQIVAARIDPASMKWEYLTESAAMA